MRRRREPGAASPAVGPGPDAADDTAALDAGADDTGADVSAPATEPNPFAVAAPARRPGAPWSVVLVALAVAAVSLAVAVVALLGRPEPVDLEAERAGALDAARERTLAITTYDYRTLDANVAAVLETATGTFEQEYGDTVEQLRGTFTESQAVAAGNVVGAGLESFGTDRAVVVVAVDQVIQSVGEAPRTERNRLRMSMTRPADLWLVEGVERL